MVLKPHFGNISSFVSSTDTKQLFFFASKVNKFAFQLITYHVAGYITQNLMCNVNYLVVNIGIIDKHCDFRTFAGIW